jgi:hypothetical protein
VHKLVTVLRRVELHDPVNSRDVDTSRTQVSGQKNDSFSGPLLKLSEPLVDLASLLLIDLAMKFEH